MKKKAIMRQEIIQQLKNFQTFAENEKKEQTQTVIRKLFQTKFYQKANKIALYVPQDFEFDLSAVFREQNKQLLIPKTLPERKMIFLPYDKNNLAKTSFGIWEPVTGQEVIPDLMIVPGLLWNSENYRIGFGGGYYDRYLAEFKGNTISLAYDFQLAEFLPEAQDIRIEEVLSV